MKFKSLESAKEFFSPIFDGNELPLKDWSKPNLTNEEAEKIIAKEKEINQTHIVVSEDNDLHFYDDDYLAYEISHARRGQFYYLLCNIKTLEISVLATTPDGSGCEVLMPDILIKWFSLGYLVL
jgi:hypothetical protein